MRAFLKVKILQAYRYQSDFAQSIGMREDRLSRIISMRIEPTQNEKNSIAKELGVTDVESLFSERLLENKLSF